MTDHLPERLATLGADPEVYRAELELASTLAQIPAGWHVEYDEAGETLLYYGTAEAGRIMHHDLGWWGGNRWHETREQAVEAQIEMWEPIIAANEADGRPPLELPLSPIGRANWGRR